MMAAFDASPRAVGVICNMKLTHSDLSDAGVTKLDNQRALGLGMDLYIMGCASAIRRSWLEVAMPFFEDGGHDRWTNRLASLVGARVVVTEPLMLYRRHAGNASAVSTNEPEGTSRMKALRIQGRADPRQGWHNRIMFETACATRLRDRMSVLAGLGLDG